MSFHCFTIAGLSRGVQVFGIVNWGGNFLFGLL